MEPQRGNVNQTLINATLYAADETMFQKRFKKIKKNIFHQFCNFQNKRTLLITQNRTKMWYKKEIAEKKTIYFKMYSKIMSKNSLKNLSAKNDGYISRRGAVVIEQTLKMFFEKNEDAEFVTLTSTRATNTDSEECALIGSFRRALKRFKMECDGAVYLWKKEAKRCEITKTRNTHFHVVVNHSGIYLLQFFLWQEVEAKREFQSVEKVAEPNGGGVPLYMAKIGECWQPYRIWSMCNEMQKYRPKAEKCPPPSINGIISETDRYIVIQN